jgi:hypothetical protein
VLRTISTTNLSLISIRFTKRGDAGMDRARVDGQLLLRVPSQPS